VKVISNQVHSVKARLIEETRFAGNHVP